MDKTLELDFLLDYFAIRYTYNRNGDTLDPMTASEFQHLYEVYEQIKKIQKERNAAKEGSKR